MAYRHVTSAANATRTRRRACRSGWCGTTTTSARGVILGGHSHWLRVAKVVRRISRFMSFGHTPGVMKLPEERITREYPFTLDLRQA